MLFQSPCPSSGWSKTACALPENIEIYDAINNPNDLFINDLILVVAIRLLVLLSGITTIIDHCLISGMMLKLPLLPLPMRRQKLMWRFSESGIRNKAMEVIPKKTAHHGYLTMNSKATFFSGSILGNEVFKICYACFRQPNHISRQRFICIWIVYQAMVTHIIQLISQLVEHVV